MNVKTYNGEVHGVQPELPARWSVRDKRWRGQGLPPRTSAAALRPS